MVTIASARPLRLLASPLRCGAFALGALLLSGCAEGSGTHAERLGLPDDDDDGLQGGSGSGNTPGEAQPMPSDFAPSEPNRLVTRQGTELVMGGDEFRFAGSNNYYLMYSSRFMIDDVLETAANAGFNTLRIWGFLDIGNADGGNSVRGPSNGVYFQYWDGQKPAQNTGANGLARLDYIIARAGQLGIKLVIPFTNNWQDFGGIDQYVRWRASASTEARTWYHDDFYTDATIKQWYKDWISALLERENSLTGVRYREDPTIAVWELGNEPRCGGSGVYPRSEACTTEVITAWADEMSAHVKSVDPTHLVSVGDEGFYCLPEGEGTSFTETCGDGVDSRALIALPNIDVMSVHLYPNDWGTTPDWGTDWIARHIDDARAAGKASLVGEFGLTNKNIRNRVYRDWTNAVIEGNGNGALYWILSGREDNGNLYGDFDGYTIYAGTPTFQLLENFAQTLLEGASDFAPIADDDVGYLTHDTSASFSVLGNDIAYGPDTGALVLDLDLTQDGVQASVTLDGTLFEAQPDGSVRVTPQAGFVGRQQVPYRVSDSQGRVSNEASLSVVVSPDPVLFASFETSSEGWAAQNLMNGGTATQSNAFATQGSFGLEVSGTTFNWFGVQSATPIDLSARRALTYDVQVGAQGTTRAARLFVGTQRCTSDRVQLEPNRTHNVEIDLTNLTCDSPNMDLSNVTSVYLLFGAGTYRLDNVQLK
jgi:mannan endo-1,4-beta-mannosidase